ncbi:co-chaperone DjlA [Psychrosphaera aquimarina]|uniref:Co-chaperone protein DjlA n=1 Tax=Psychrosphaera aquimarina TaxID=2044854 RepID=A0ABU3R490_9GAMM|nr:co-chaperone DjlA [Psychrosphaera aquimarina]MDU0114468.1 co-chaperone DjlA [Psychrosphaera aquimarina]
MTGKIVGAFFGFLLLRNIVGALIGLYLGHLFDRAVKRFANKQNVEQWLSSGDSKQAIFFYTTFSVMGHVAKASGNVTPEHIQTANEFMTHMGLSKEQVAEAKEAFREGKSLGFPIKKKINLFKQYFGKRQDLCQFFIEIQIQTAYSDSILEPAEYELLLNIAKQLGFTKRHLGQLIVMWEAELRFQNYKKDQQQKNRKYERRRANSSSSDSGDHQRQNNTRDISSPSVADAYALLGISENETTKEIKRAYKRLMSQNHPDKLVAKGLPPEMMEVAKQKTQDIQSAYEIIKKARKF